ncbi:tyrosine-type recombinase/integrase [Salinimicrobium tongyeongense]|uniref:Tyrosine-type recombinase/integrase n=1 Tax=Salinimicrobium tongyeongense TaxID=2809707 RepID=A0ABY6NT08_9FLAO|nr:site-specific integrase [Salinimicrobium tongyeongense]UZH56044.1 tyrosine-type recombinase/integrase [Salinimicrobium tongyeongense]
MATVNFLYRSTREKAPLNLRLLFRHNDKDFAIGGKTKLEVTRDYWNNHHSKQRLKDIEVKNLQTEVNNKLAALENHILKAFNSTQPGKVNKDWLKTTIEHYYNPPQQKIIPTDLVSYIDYYLEHRKNEITEANRKKVKVTKNKMLRLQKELGKPILINEVNEDFKKAYVDFSNKNAYSQNTQHREFVLIKTICFHARYLGVKTHHQLDGITLQREEANHIYLNLEELEKVKKADLKQDYLDNARDWLLISCYTGQRVSDFMRFKPEMIRTENGKPLLEFRQKKTKKEMSIPVVKEVREILEKRNGKFPRPISDQRYNDYIKEVCKEAKIKDEVKGKRRVSIAPKGVKPTKNDYRDVLDTFEKWELVSSHIGRRSFATNFYGKVPTTYLINITGHGSEKMFLNYIKKSNKDLALDAFNYFE